MGNSSSWWCASLEIRVQTSQGIKDQRAMIRKIMRVKTHDATQYCVHVQWLRTSAVGQEDELFLDHGHCQTVPIKFITAKLDFVLLPPGVSAASTTCTYFARYIYDADRNHWSAPTGRLADCDGCLYRREHYDRGHVRIAADGGFSINGEEYHKNDLVFLDSNSTGEPWTVAQILKVPDFLTERGRVDRNCIDIQHLEIQGQGQKVLSQLGKGRIPLSQVRGKVSCRAEEEDLHELLTMERLCAADYYAGGGGSAIGARKYFKVTSMVDCDPVACATLETNFPAARIACAKLSDLLHATHTSADSNHRRGSALPNRGHIFILTAGPPCQGHSGANMFRSLDDTRNSELDVVLKVVNLLQPDFFLLENVPGFKRDWNTDTDGVHVDTDTTRNFASEAIRKLLAIEYQARLAILSSRSYGSPQNRVRLFVLAARIGIKLPNFPLPTHANPDIRATIFSVEDGEDMIKVYQGWGTPGCGPLPAVTAEEAISDLPPFEYAGNTRLNSSGPHFSATRISSRGHETRVGFTRSVPYSSPPRNEYQKRKRGSQVTVADHHTSHRSQRELDIIFGASTYAGRPGQRDIRGCERMTDPNGSFSTLMTSSRPGGKYTGPIHWNQRRTFSVAERKRIQGVPDDYILKGSIEDKDRMIGNMINVDIAEAIYGQIIIQVVLPWWRKAGRPKHVRATWRRDHPIPWSSTIA
ncbi:S-adenosyl-L-methionine-dependent methyltransferase [Naematelia encephala]|uniref:DNA (cytosine-5-)-methyltransferase n=1 Tax=Naematelia encephala TaxID=71784 RepID=A0A1Y2ANK0_9TREE|nr:S-adenosyl-L-methionine-dependent methyltransferase [Naematelia encephala]